MPLFWKKKVAPSTPTWDASAIQSLYKDIYKQKAPELLQEKLDTLRSLSGKSRMAAELYLEYQLHNGQNKHRPGAKLKILSQQRLSTASHDVLLKLINDHFSQSLLPNAAG